MKKLTLKIANRQTLIALAAILSLALATTSCDPTEGEDIVKHDSISMGASYVNDIFYSLENGIVATKDRSEWDIAFSTNPMSSTVLINEGAGVELYTYPNGALADWDNVDTTGLSLTPMYNADTTWFYGAFDRNDSGHPDYGWGIYNMNSHDVVGDSIFLLQLSDGTLKRLSIDKRAAMSNTFTITYANYSGESSSKDIACGDYTDKNFIYFSFATESIVDYEPALTDWDLLFTRYHDESIPYYVTGVLSNEVIEIAEVVGDPATADHTSASYSNDINIIGSDWKSFDMATFSYIVEENLCYLLKKEDGSIYKLTFLATDGSATGKMVFDLEELQ